MRGNKMADESLMQIQLICLMMALYSFSGIIVKYILKVSPPNPQIMN